MTLEDFISNASAIEGAKVTHLVVPPDVALFVSEIQARNAMGKSLTKRAVRRIAGRARAFGRT